MKTRVNICFIARKKRGHLGAQKQPTTPIHILCRVKVLGRAEESEWHTGLETTYGNWEACNGMGRVVGRTAADRHINTQLTKLRDQLNDIHADLERQGLVVRAQTIARLYKTNGCTLTMQELFAAFIEERKELVGIEIGAASVKIAASRQGSLRSFLEAKKLTEIRPEEFTHNMGDKFMLWSQKECGHKRNYANKMLQTIIQVLRWGVRREYLVKNPMELYSFKMAETAEIKYLTVGEISTLRAAVLPDKLARVRDCFVFQCWTGLAYADLAALDVTKDAEYRTDASGTLRRLLRVRRQKSTMHHGYECVIPLLPEAERILSQYEDELPVPSNQVYNRFLKEIAEACDLPADKMTSHVGRKTAGVLMLNMGIRMEVVSKFLGHSSVKMTEKVYAKILDTTLTSEFDRVFSAVAATPAHAPLQLLPAPVVVEVFEPAQVVGHAPRKQPAPPTRKAKRKKAQAIGAALAAAPQKRPSPMQFEMIAAW